MAFLWESGPFSKILVLLGWVTPNTDFLVWFSRPWLHASWHEIREISKHFHKFVVPYLTLRLSPLQWFPCFPQTFGFNNARRHTINRIQVDQIRISQDRQSFMRRIRNAPALQNWLTHTRNTEMRVEYIHHVPRSISNTAGLGILENERLRLRTRWVRVWRTPSHKKPTWADKMKEDSLSALIDGTLFKIDSAESTQKL